MYDWLSILVAIGSMAGIVVLTGSAFVYIKGTYNKEVSSALRADLADEKTRHLATQVKADTLEAALDSKNLQITVLTDVATQHAEVDKVLNLLQAHHDESMHALNAAVDKIAEVARMLTEHE